VSDLERTGPRGLDPAVRRQLLATADRLDALVGAPAEDEGVLLPPEPIGVRAVDSLGEHGWLVAWADGVVAHFDSALVEVERVPFRPLVMAVAADGEHAVALGRRALLRWSADGSFAHEERPEPARPTGRAVLSPNGDVLATVERGELVLRGWDGEQRWPVPEEAAGIVLSGCVPPVAIGIVDGTEVWVLGDDPGPLATLEERAQDSAVGGGDLVVLDDEAWWGSAWDDLEERTEEQDRGSGGPHGSVLGPGGQTVATPALTGNDRVLVRLQGGPVRHVVVERWPAAKNVAVSEQGVLLGHRWGFELHDGDGRHRRGRSASWRRPLSANGRRLAASTGAAVLVLGVDGGCEHVVPATGPVRNVADSGRVLACGGTIWALDEVGTWSGGRLEEDGSGPAWCTPNGQTAIFAAEGGRLTARAVADGQLRWRRTVDGLEPAAPLVELSDQHLVFRIGRGFEAVRVADGLTTYASTADDGLRWHRGAEPDVVLSHDEHRFRRLDLTTLRAEEGELPFSLDGVRGFHSWHDRWYVTRDDGHVDELRPDGSSRDLGPSRGVFVRPDGSIVLVARDRLRIVPSS